MSLDAELQRLTKDDKPADAARFGALVRANAEGWTERLQLVPRSTEWALLSAYLARVDCDADFSSPVHAERLDIATRKFDQLFYRDGEDYAMADPHRRTLVARLRPGVLLGWGGLARE